MVYYDPYVSSYSGIDWGSYNKTPITPHYSTPSYSFDTPWSASDTVSPSRTSAKNAVSTAQQKINDTVKQSITDLTNVTIPTTNIGQLGSDIASKIESLSNSNVSKLVTDARDIVSKIEYPTFPTESVKFDIDDIVGFSKQELSSVSDPISVENTILSGWNSIADKFDSHLSNVNGFLTRAITSGNYSSEQLDSLRDSFEQSNIESNNLFQTQLNYFIDDFENQLALSVDANLSDVSSIIGQVSQIVADYKDRVATLAANGIDDVSKTLIESMLASTDVSEISDSIEVAEVAFSGILSANQSAQDTIDSNAAKWMDMALDGSTFVADSAVLASDEIKSRANLAESNVFDATELAKNLVSGAISEAQNVISESESDIVDSATGVGIGSILRDYNRQVGTGVVDQITSLPADTKSIMRDSLVFSTIITDAIGTGQPDEVIRDVLTGFGHEIVSMSDLTELQSSGQLEGKYVYDPYLGFMQAVTNNTLEPIRDDISNFISDQIGSRQVAISDAVDLSGRVEAATIMYNDLYGKRGIEGLKTLFPTYEYVSGEFTPVSFGGLIRETPESDQIALLNDFKSYASRNILNTVEYNALDFNCDDFANVFIKQATGAVDPQTGQNLFSPDAFKYGYVSFNDGTSHATVLYQIGTREFENGSDPIYAMYDPKTDTWFNPSDFGGVIDYVVVSDGIKVDGENVLFDSPEYAYLSDGTKYSAKDFTVGVKPLSYVASAPDNISQLLTSAGINPSSSISRADIELITSPSGIQLLDLAGIGDDIKLSDLTLPELVVLNEVMKGTELDYSRFYSPDTARTGWLTETSRELTPTDIENLVMLDSVLQPPTLSVQYFGEGIINSIKNYVTGDKSESDSVPIGKGSTTDVPAGDIKPTLTSPSVSKDSSIIPQPSDSSTKIPVPTGMDVEISVSPGYKVMTDLSILDPSHPQHSDYMDAYNRKYSPTTNDIKMLERYGVPEGGIQAGQAALDAQKSLATSDLSSASNYVRSISELAQQQAKVGQPVDTKVLDYKSIAQKTSDSDRGIAETTSNLSALRTILTADPRTYSVAETIAKIVPEELITTTAANRYTNAGLVDGNRATEEGRQLANDLVTTMLITGGPVIEGSTLKTLSQVASPTFPITAVLKEGGIIDGVDVNGTKFSESEMVDFVLKYGTDEQIASLRSSGSVSKYLSVEAPDEWSTAKIRTASNDQIAEIVENTKNFNTDSYIILPEKDLVAEGNDLRWSAVVNDDRILTLADGSRVISKTNHAALSAETGYNAGEAGIRTLPKDMDVEIGLSLRDDDLVSSTTWRGNLNLTEIGESIVTGAFNKLIVDPNSLSNVPTERKELISYGLDDYQIKSLAKPGATTVISDVEIQLPSLLDNVIDNELFENLSNRLEISNIASNPGAALAISYKNDWLDRGWIDIDGSVTPSGAVVRDAIISNTILDTKGSVEIDGVTLYSSPAVKAFALSTISEPQQNAIKSDTGAYERLTMSEQLSIGERGKSIGERLSSITNSAAELGWEFMFAPGFEDEGLNAALFLSGILPIGKVGAIGSKGLRALLKSDDGVKILVNAFKKSDDVEASAKSLLDAETKLGKNSDDFTRLVSSLKKELGDDNYAKIADRVMEIRGAASVLDPEWVTSSSLAKVLSTARTADGQAALAKISDRDFALLKTNIGDADKLAALTKERDSAIRAAKQFTREPEFQTAEEAKSFLDWGSYQEKLAGKSPEVIEQVKKNTGLGVSIDAAKSLGELRNAYKTANGKSVFDTVIERPIKDITQYEAALLSPNELSRIQQKATTAIEITGLADLRNRGIVDIIEKSGIKLDTDQIALITKLRSGKDLSPHEAATLAKLAETIGETNARSLALTWADARYAKTAFKLGIMYVGAVSFATFLLEEQAQTSGQFSLMGSDYDPMKFSDSLRTGIGNFDASTYFTDRAVVQILVDNSVLSALFPQVGAAYDYVTETNPNYLRGQRELAIAYGTWIPEGDFTYTWRGVEHTVEDWGRPATLDEYLNALREDPSKLNYLDSTAFQKYVNLLGWNDKIVADYIIDGTIVGKYGAVSTNIKSIVDAATEIDLPAQVKSGEMTLPEYIQQGLTLKDSWRVPEVQAQFLKPDGSWDSQKIAFAVDRGQLGLYELGTYTPDATRALLTEASRNIDLTDTLYNALKDESTFKAAMETLDPETWGLMAQTVGIPAENLYMLEDDPKLGKVFQLSGLPDSIPIFSIGVSSDEMANRVLYDGGISESDRKVWLDTFDDVSLTNDEIGYLYASGVISDLYKYNLPSDIEKQIISTVSTLGKDAAADRYLELSGHQFIALDTPIGPRTVSTVTEVTPVFTVGVDRFPTINMLIDNPSLLSTYYNDPKFKAEFDLLYSEDPNLALNIYNAVLSTSDSAFRDDYINSLNPVQRGRLLEGYSNASNYTTNGVKDPDKGSYVNDRTLYWVDAAGVTHREELTNSRVPELCVSIFDPATDTTYRKSDLSKMLGIPEDKFTIDGAKWISYVDGKATISTLKDILIFEDQESAKKYGGGGGGGGGGRGSGSSYYSSGTIGIFVDCNVEADVSVGGTTIGKTGALIPMAPGEYTITVSKSGYAPKTKVVLVLSTKATNVTVTLYPGDYNVCDFVESLGGTTSVQKSHFIYAYCKYRNWDQAAAAALALFTPPDMMPKDFTRDEAQYLYYLADGYYSDAKAMIDAGTICGGS